MKYYLPVLTMLFLFGCQSNSGKEQPKAQTEQTMSKTNTDFVAKAVTYNAFLEIDEQNVIPFTLEKTANGPLYVVNGSEKIKILDSQANEENLNFTMPVFNSTLSTKIVDGNLVGEWDKYPGAEKEYKMPFYAFDKKSQLVPPRFTDYNLQIAAGDKETAQMGGKWKVEFSPNTEDAYPAIGEFEQKGNDITGTFMTETGDYRFLAGKIYGDGFYLSCFDGSHAFLFKGTIENNQMKGEFLSGKHWKEPFVAQKDANYNLGDPYKLTYLKDANARFDFELSDLNGTSQTLKDLQKDGKSVLVQIFGTWCPNCMDETQLYTEWYKEYKNKNIEFVGVAFERKGELDKDKKAIDDYIKHFGIEYPILYGGKASKKLASEKFPMLNKIISFPTTILLDKEGKVVKIHTGFNGPATSVYQEYKKEMEALLDKLSA